MNPIRVLYVRNCRGISIAAGAEAYLLSLMKGFAAHECEPLLACITDPRHGHTSWLQELDAHQLSVVMIPVQSRFGVRDLTTLPKLIRQFEPDIVHSMDHRADVVSIFAARAAGKLSIASFLGWTNWQARSTRGWLYPWLDRQALKYAHAIISDSAAMGAQVDFGAGGPPVVVIPNGIDTDVFDPAQTSDSFKRRCFPESNMVLVGMVARIHPNKGQLDFVKAAAELSRSYPQCRFVIVGDAPPGYENYKAEVTGFITKHGLQDKIVLTHVSHSEIPTVMAGIDIVVGPSYTESFSFTLLEGMAMARPVIATPVGGIPQMITDGESGLLTPPGDWQALSRMIETLVISPELRQQLGRRARQRIEADFSIKGMVTRTLRVYQEVIEWGQQQSRSVQTTQKLRVRLNAIATS